MAMNRFGEVIDLVGGRRDIKHKTLRTIGDAQKRLKRSIASVRACRFVAKLDFLPTEDLLEAMPKAFHRVPGVISRESS